MPSLRFALNCTIFGILVFTSISSRAADSLSPRAEVSVKGGSERSTLTTEFWAPLAQKSDRVVYTDLRLMGDDDDNREGNLGIGYRQVYEPTNSVLGIHGWIDRRRTEHNSTFHQVTLGVESLGDKIDLRMNGYIPLNDGRVVTTPNLGSATPYLAGNGLFYDTTGSINETPQYGMDAEAGYRLPIFEKQVDTLRVYGGGYHFFRSSTEDVTGFRIRTEAQINQIVSVGARFQHDGPRGSQGFLEATIRFPFSAKKLYQKSGLVSRLDESPERDIDIVTASKVDTGLHKEITNATSGEAQHILYVDNTQTNGDGTKEHPFNNLQSAQAALQANDILYIFHGDGTTHNMDQGIRISQSGVQLIGSGSALTVSGITFLQAGTAPVITNTQTTIDTETGFGIYASGNNNLISGVTVQNTAGHGILYVSDTANLSQTVTIDNVTVQGAGKTGIFIISRTAGANIDSASITNSTISNNAQYGIILQANAGAGFNNSFVENTTLNNNTFEGIIAIAVGNNANINHVNLDNITAISNRTGVFARATGGGKINNFTISNLVSNNNSQQGLWVTAEAGSSINNATLSNINSFNNASYGTWVYATGSGSIINNATLNNIVTNNNLMHGTYTSAVNGGQINQSTLSNITAVNNGSHGVYTYASNAGQINQSTLSNITATNNGSHGVRWEANGIGAMITNITASNLTTNGNTASNSVGVIAQNSGVINTVDLSAVTASNNALGITIAVNTNATIGQANIRNVVLSNNSQQGLLLQSQGNGLLASVNLQNIIANNNTQNGVYIQNSGGSISNVTSSVITANNNKNSGVFVSSTSGALDTINLSSITTNNNLLNGIYLNATGTAILNNVNISSSNVTANTQYGVYVNDDTSGTFLVDLGGGALNSIGQNRIFGNISSDIRVDVDGGQLKAKNNWWGANTGLAAGKVSYEDSSTIDSTAFLTTDPRP